MSKWVDHVPLFIEYSCVNIWINAVNTTHTFWPNAIIFDTHAMPHILLNVQQQRRIQDFSGANKKKEDEQCTPRAQSTDIKPFNSDGVHIRPAALWIYMPSHAIWGLFVAFWYKTYWIKETKLIQMQALVAPILAAWNADTLKMLRLTKLIYHNIIISMFIRHDNFRVNLTTITQIPSP